MGLGSCWGPRRLGDANGRQMLPHGSGVNRARPAPIGRPKTGPAPP